VHARLLARSPYFHNDDPTEHRWEGYDAAAQADLAIRLIQRYAGSDRPFVTAVSWGPPHFPLHTAPPEQRAAIADRRLVLRPNVPAALTAKADEEMRGYYAHIEALDGIFARIMACLDATGLADDTIVVLTSDHGELRRSQGLETKFFPFEESLRVPFLVRWPAGLGRSGRTVHAPIDSPDILPTLAGLAGVPVARPVQGRDWSPELRGDRPVDPEADAYCLVPAALTEMCQYDLPGWRGLRSRQWNLAVTAHGPWLLHDLQEDPYQMRNRIDDPACAGVRERLLHRLAERMRQVGDTGRWDLDLVRDHGLDHYREVHMPPHSRWTSPWGDDPAWLRARRAAT
jgi:arylsulfatase A-like enzyme